MHRVLVQRNVDQVAHLLDLRARQTQRTHVPQDQVVVRAVRAQLVALVHQRLRQRLRVLLDLDAVLLELGRRHLSQLRRDGGDLVVVGTALKGTRRR